MEPSKPSGELKIIYFYLGTVSRDVVRAYGRTGAGHSSHQNASGRCVADVADSTLQIAISMSMQWVIDSLVLKDALRLALD